MLFAEQLQPDIEEIYSYMGYGGTKPDAATVQAASLAATRVAMATRAKWCVARFALRHGADGITLGDTGVLLTGHNIAAHLAGCNACLLLAVTLGAGVDATLRAAGAGDMRDAVLMDTAASVLVEQYAYVAQKTAIEQCKGDEPYASPRFSPGYGDLPLALQKDVAFLLDTPRAIGLTVSESGILVPRKSVTAIIGLASTPVQGALAGCATCALAATCTKDKPCATAQKE